jgi:hypothetical protein
LGEEASQEVQGFDLLVLAIAGDAVSSLQCFLGFGGEIIERHML